MLSPLKLHQRRKERQRYKLRTVSSDRLRLSGHRTSQHMYAQIIDDSKACTLLAFSTLSAPARSTLKGGGNKDAAAFVGANIAKLALEKGITKVVFDRSGLLYHGRVKVLADAAREHGLIF